MDRLRVQDESFVSQAQMAELFECMDDVDPGQRKGYIDIADLRRIADTLGDTIADCELEAMIQGASSQDDGRVTCEDFYQTMVKGIVKKPESGILDGSEKLGTVLPSALARMRSKVFAITSLTGAAKTSRRNSKVNRASA